MAFSFVRSESEAWLTRAGSPDAVPYDATRAVTALRSDYERWSRWALGRGGVGLAALGWAVGSAVGAGVGLLSARLQLIRNASEPLLFVFGAIPALVLAPFCLVWFGQGPLGKFVLVAFYCFVSVGLVAQSAAAALPPTIEEYGATQGLGPRARFIHIVVPAALPAVLAGLRVALSTGIAVQATVELLGSQFGAGRLIAIRAPQGDVSAVLGLSIAVGVVAILLDVVLRRTIRIFTRWQ